MVTQVHVYPSFKYYNKTADQFYLDTTFYYCKS